MAAPMKNAVRTLWRPIFGNIHKFCASMRQIPAAAFCEEAVSRRLKFDVSSVYATKSLESEEPEIEEETLEQESFATMFRKSKFVQLGDLKDRTLAGRIFNVGNDDLYIDFGGKFYCVCPRPSFQAHQYVKGQRVRVMVHKFEMTSSFLGSEQHLTLLEADATLLGLFDQIEQTSHKKDDKISPVSDGFASRMMAGVNDMEKNVHNMEESIETVAVDSGTETVGTNNTEDVTTDNSVKPQ